MNAALWALAAAGARGAVLLAATALALATLRRRSAALQMRVAAVGLLSAWGAGLLGGLGPGAAGPVGGPEPLRLLRFAVSMAAAPVRRADSWMVAVALLYGTVTAVLLLRMAVGIAATRRLRRTATPITDAGALERLREAALAAGLTKAPELAAGAAIQAPLTLAGRPAVILLPAAWRRWPMARLEAVLMHETAHVAHRDAARVRLALLYRACFWFDPLSGWMLHRIAELAEWSSDEAALAAGADAELYAAALVEFWSGLRRGGGRVDWATLGMAAGAEGAERRLRRILHWQPGKTATSLTRAQSWGLALLAMPLLVLTVATRPVAEPLLPRLAQNPAVPAAAPAGVVATAAVPAPPPAPFGADVTPPVVVSAPSPHLPPDAPPGTRRVVNVGIRIGADGKVTDPKVEAPDDDFARAAVAAVSTWIFKPALWRGQPVPVPAVVQVNFRQY